MKRITAIILIVSLLSGFCVTATADLMPDYWAELLVNAISEDGAKDIKDPDKILPFGKSYTYSSYYKDKNGNIIVVIEDFDSQLVYPSTLSDSTTPGDAATPSEPFWKTVKIEYHIRIEDLSGPGVENIKYSVSGLGFIKDFKRFIDRLDRFFRRWFMSFRKTLSLYK